MTARVASYIGLMGFSLFLCFQVTDKGSRCPAANPPCEEDEKCPDGHTDKLLELQRLRAELHNARGRAVDEAGLTIRQEIERAKAHPPRDRFSHHMQPETAEAIRICAEARDPNCIPFLIQAIDFFWDDPREPLKIIATVKDTTPPYKAFPARSALVVIGVPAARSLVYELARQGKMDEPSPRQHFLLTTLAAIAGPEGALRFFNEAIAAEPSDEGRRLLREAREAFKKMGSTGRCTENPMYQLYQGTVFKDIAAPPDEPKEPSFR